MYTRRISALGVLAAALALAACGSSSGDADAAPATQGGGQGGRGGPGGPGGAGGGGQRASSITLAATDVAPARIGSIQDGVAITGDLRPIESVDVRARIEGDIVGVYVREGQHVQTGQVLARFEAVTQESDRQSAVADRASAQSQLATAEWSLEQSSALFKAGAISENDYKIAQQNVVSARARLAAADARVAAASTTARDTRVVSTTSGIVDKRSVEPGEHVSRGATLFSVVRNDVLELAAAVPARQANTVREGQPVTFVADGRTITGRVARVSPTIDPSNRSVAVYVQVANRDGTLKGGTFATGRIISRTVPNALVVPSGAIRQRASDGAPYVYVVAAGRLDVADVQLGVVDDRAGLAQITSGLKSGDVVVVGNVGTLGRGMQVQIMGQEGARNSSARSGAPSR